MAPRIRFTVDPGDIPAEKAARRLHLTVDDFTAMLPALLERGFPPADPTTGMYDLDAIDAWRRSRFPRLFRLTESSNAVNSREVIRARIDRL